MKWYGDKRGCHAEALEARREWPLRTIHREPQDDTPHFEAIV